MSLPDSFKSAIKARIVCRPGAEADVILYEILDCDSYGLQNLPFFSPPPGAILDLGANIGVFTAAAREAFPDVPIYCVEPSYEAFQALMVNTQGLYGIVSYFTGIGDGSPLGPVTTGGSLGTVYYGPKDGGEATSIRLSSMLDINWDCNVLIKLDCEGGEAAIRGHAPSEECLRKSWGIVGELHWGLRWGKTSAEEWMDWFHRTLSNTHDILGLFNSQPTRKDPTTQSGNIQVFAMRKDIA